MTLTRNNLKIIAIVAMTIDHIGYMFTDKIIANFIGMLNAYPLFPNSRGGNYTKSIYKYASRMAFMYTP